jgi:hypothetical protein
LTLYRDLKKEGIDIFNPADPAFTDRCYTHINNETGADTTISWRQQNYIQKISPMCIGINCTYQGISEFDYVQCNCTGLQSDNNIVNELVNFVMTSVSSLNIGVIFCYKVISIVNIFLY